jgi:hypothetical protein
MIPAWIRNSSSIRSALSFALIPVFILALALAVLGPRFGTTADPFITYTIISLLASPFALLGFAFSIFAQTTPARKGALIATTTVATLFAAWPILAVLLLLFALKGPINPG